MSLLIGNAQHVGGRPNQQDSFGFSNPADSAFRTHGGMLAVLADGMGGLAHGAEASRLAVKAFLAAYEMKAAAETIPAALLRSLAAASQHLQELAIKLGDLGSTLVAAVVRDGELHWISVGDSSLLLIRSGYATHVNTPHTFAVHLGHAVAEGRITLDQASQHPERESLTSNLGPAEPNEIDRSLRPLLLRNDDRVLLCSDGLSKVVPPEQIVALASGHPQEASERMVEAALHLGGAGQDNITVLALWNEPERAAFRPPLATTASIAVAPPDRRKRLVMLPVAAGVVAAGIAAAAFYWPRPVDRPPLPHKLAFIAAPVPALKIDPSEAVHKAKPKKAENSTAKKKDK